ncbi:DsbA family protein [Desulfovibrio mangrovi]|uniref:DsbA family protein n=1 Tax=Desulfovibrio mangrovi TaxID=2976983 RepID=UPI002247D391|nr:DsbA family protein [Desulfovibrio mangrovi]UZP66496.1 DsbA family protein [Desulfovibrio mangrovi]
MFHKALTAALLISLCLFAGTASAADATTTKDNEALKQQLESILRENPEVLMNVLRENSEELFMIMREGSQKAQRKAITAQWKNDVDVPKTVNLKNRLVRGDADSPVTIVAFSDFTCPYCEQAAFTVNTILKHYGKTVRFVFKNFPLASHEHARTASEYFVAAGLQDKDKAWKLYDAIFANRAVLIADGEPFLKDTAASLGLDVKRLEADAKSTAVKAIIDEDTKEAQDFGFSGTPYFLVNNIVIRGALPFDLFSEAVDLALDHANKKK